MPDTSRLDRGDGVRLAYRLDAAGGAGTPTLVFLPGLNSDMTGDKATALAAHAARRGAAMLRLDYSGHGQSDGRFEDGTIGRWTADALLLIDRLTTGPLVVVGSSMGGWIAMLVALARPERVAALVGIAAAPDFTEQIWARLDQPTQARLLATGAITLADPDGPELPISRALIEDGRTHCLLASAIPISCPVRLLHGQRDGQVPWRTALSLAGQLAGADVRLTLIKDGEHRLSRPADLALLLATVDPLLDSVASDPEASGPEPSGPAGGFLAEDAA